MFPPIPPHHRSERTQGSRSTSSRADQARPGFSPFPVPFHVFLPVVFSPRLLRGRTWRAGMRVVPPPARVYGTAAALPGGRYLWT